MHCDGPDKDIYCRGRNNDMLCSRQSVGVNVLSLDLLHIYCEFLFVNKCIISPFHTHHLSNDCVMCVSNANAPFPAFNLCCGNFSLFYRRHYKYYTTQTPHKFQTSDSTQRKRLQGTIQSCKSPKFRTCCICELSSLCNHCVKISLASLPPPLPPTDIVSDIPQRMFQVQCMREGT